MAAFGRIAEERYDLRKELASWNAEIMEELWESDSTHREGIVSSSSPLPRGDIYYGNPPLFHDCILPFLYMSLWINRKKAHTYGRKYPSMPLTSRMLTYLKRINETWGFLLWAGGWVLSVWKQSETSVWGPEGQTLSALLVLIDMCSFFPSKCAGNCIYPPLN